MTRDISLPRVDAREVTPAEFAKRYGVPSVPCVVTNLFHGQPIDSLTRAKARNEYGNVRVPYFAQYAPEWASFLAEFHRGDSVLEKMRPWIRLPESDPDRLAAPVTPAEDPATADMFGVTTIGDYLDGKIPGNCYVHEIPTPAQFKALYQWPRYADPSLYPWSDREAKPDHWHQLLFIGHRGRRADLHCHHDINHVLLHQVFGQKTAVLLPPEAGSKVFAITQVSNINLSACDAVELEHFARYAGGYVDVVRPGESLFIPSIWWHYLRYDEHTMSVNFKFAPVADEDVQFLSQMSSDPRHKRIACALRDPQLLNRYRPRIQKLRALMRSSFAGAHRKQRTSAAVMQEMFAEIFPNEVSSALIDPMDLLASFAAYHIEVPRPRRYVSELLRRVGYRMAGLG